MKKTLKLTCFCLAIIMMVLAVLPLTAFAAESEDVSQTQTLEVENFSIHNMTDNSGYAPSNSNKVSAFCSGHTRLGTLKVTGDIEKKTYNGVEAYAVYGGEISFEYKQSWTNKSNNDHDWKLSSDSATSINGVGTGTIGDGGFLVMKSLDDGATWVKAATSVSINNDTITFTADGKDVRAGVMYKFISVCETYYEYTYQSGTETKYPSYWDAPWAVHVFGGPVAVGIWVAANSWEEPVYSTANHCENLAQQTVVYVASDSAEVGFYSTATDNYDISGAFEDVSAETLEILKKGTTLSHNSVSFDQIRVDKLGNSSFDVVCSYNNSSFFTVEDGEIFTQLGKYHFVITTKFLTQRELDLWILKIGDDMAYSQYFGNSFVSQDKRVFDKNSQLPVYMVGSTLNVAPAANVPGLCGHIYRYADAAAVDADQYEIVHTFTSRTKAATITLDQTGIYCADLFAGDPNACGEIIHYGFYLVVVDNEDYMPTVNLEMLTSADRHVMLKTTGYAVNFATAGGGSYVFMFEATSEGYEAALEFSEAIEYRFIEEYTGTNGNKYYYYKAHGTSGLKERFDSKVELNAAVTSYAKANVNLTYTNNTEAYATMTMDEAVANIENTSIRNDIKVCIDTQTRDNLVAEDIILNGYVFYQAAVYESSSVTATAEDGTVYTIPYDTAVETVLPSTGRYLITESNWHGTNTYYVTYIAADEVTGSISYVAYKDYAEFSGKIDSSVDAVIEANTITLVSAEDKYDTQTIVTISRVGERKNMLLSEVDGYTISEPGTYSITITNRCGFTTTTTVKLTEAPKTEIKFANNEQWDRTVKFGETLGELPEAECYGKIFLGWMVDGELVTPSTICTWADEVTLTPWFEAKAVTVIMNYFGGYSTISAKYGETVALPTAENINGYHFGYWSLNGKEIEELVVDTLDTIVLVANYYEYNEVTQKMYSTAYTTYEITPLAAQRPSNNGETSTDESETDDVFLGTESDTIQSDNTHSEANNTINFNAEGTDTDDGSSNGSTVMIIVAVSICTVAALGAVVAIIKKRRA